MQPTITLCSGRTFNFARPRALTLFEVASSLSKLCRFNGHCRRFYSVAQHSVLVSDIAPHEFHQQAFLHDAVEAVVGDVTSPLKRLIPGYQEIEDACERVILRGFGLPETLDEMVKHYDLVALATEKRDLMPLPDPDMDWSIIQDIAPLPTYISPVGPDEAYEMFMSRALGLGF